MTNQINLMIDLETWGTTPGSDIRSIGACRFDPSTGFVHDGSLGTIRPFYIATDNPILGRDDGLNITWLDTLGFVPNTIDPCFDEQDLVYRKYPLTRDPRTVQWWSEQSDEARAAFADPVDLQHALYLFAKWLCVLDGQPLESEQPLLASQSVRIWAHGPSFDVSILEACYRAVNLPVPWYYRAPRDTRTAFDMAGIDDHSAWLQRYNHGTAHHALDDAICQARAVCAAYETVRSWADAYIRHYPAPPAPF